ncbi:MAG: hypothetical protein KDD10_12330 [Phaeodactylibacter sp.]|nr:hypothetical protein [Phaeodactylibacter sp.]
MITAIIETVTDANGQYGPEKISAVTMADGGQTKVYTKPKAASIYDELKPGLQVELMPKSSGTGYLIKRIIPDGGLPSNFQQENGAPAVHHSPRRKEPSREEIGEFIRTKAGQYFYAYSCLKEQFDNDKNGILVTEETLRAGAATVIISLDRNLY